jgi:xanthine dehydrogenase accessory factor
MGKMPLYTMLQKARSAGGWTMVAQLEGDAAGSQLLLLEGRPVWQRGDSTVLLQHLTELQGCTAAGIHSVAGTDIFAERFGAVPQLVVCGGGHVAAAVVQLAKLLGLTVLAMDDREEYAQQLRLAGACRLKKRLRRYLTAQRLILWSSPGHMHLMWTA